LFVSTLALISITRMYDVILVFVHTYIYLYMDVYVIYRWIHKLKKIKKGMFLDPICIYRYTHVHAYVEKFMFLHI